MSGTDGGSPRGIARGRFGLLIRLNPDPVLRDDERAACLVRHVAPDAACPAIHRTQTRMILDGYAMASQTSLFGSCFEHRAGRVLMRVVAVGARDLTPALTPALAIHQGRHLVGNQCVVRHGVFDDTGTRVALRAGAHPLGERQALRIQDAQVSRVRVDRGYVRLTRTMAVFAGDAGLDARSVSPWLAVAAQTRSEERRVG